MNRTVALGLGLAALTLSGRAYAPSHPMALAHQRCPVSPSILWGLANAESGMNPRAVSKDGHDKGLFQHRDTWYAARGIKDPFDVVEATRHAIVLLEQAITKFGSTSMALASYRQGVWGVQRDGITDSSKAYVKRIITWNKGGKK